jgi:predicted transcriptional regulator YheO
LSTLQQPKPSGGVMQPKIRTITKNGEAAHKAGRPPQEIRAAAKKKVRGVSKSRAQASDVTAEAKLELLDDLVPKLARAIAPICEVVLHQNTSRPPTIRAIGNGHVTGRTVGDLMTQILINGEDVRDRSTPLFNYLSKVPDGRQIRVSLIPITHDGRVIAYLAVNFLVQDLAMARQALSVLVQAEPHAEAIEEKFLSPHDVIEKSVDDFLHTSGRPVELLEKRERIELIRRLRDRGVFSMRGAVDEVASSLGVSRTAVYNYLNEVDEGTTGKHKRTTRAGA